MVLGQIILPEASASGRNHSQAKAVLVFAGDFGSSVLTEEFFGRWKCAQANATSSKRGWSVIHLLH